MLKIITTPSEQWDSAKQEFIYTKSYTFQIEHSLISLAKWESKWCKPFLSKENKTYEETIDYVKCMTVTQNVPDEAYEHIDARVIKEVNEYIEAPMTATWFSDRKHASKASNEQITAELIYYWMIALNIPFECQKWHLNRLLTLIRVCNIKNQPPKKRSKSEILRQHAAINAARRKAVS